VKTKTKWIILAIVLLPILIGTFLLFSSGSMSENVSFMQGKRIGLVRIENVILGAEKYTSVLQEFLEDKSIAGVVLKINSPGGAVAPSQEIYQAVLRYRSAGKPLVAAMENVAASGGYYVSCPAQKIFANPGTLTGSIGVILQLSQYYKLLDKIGIDMETIKTGEFKDIGNPARAITGKERKFFKNLLEDSHKQFVHDICAVRSLDCSEVSEIADGRIFTGKQALDLGLVDTLGSYHDALNYCRSLAGLDRESKVYEKKERTSFLRSLLAETKLFNLPISQTALSPGGMYYLLQL